MSLRITKVDEYQFLTCLKHNVWGSRTDRFKSWEIGDKLAFIVNKQFTTLAEVTGNSYKSEEKVWDNGDFPYRINIKFLIILSTENRIPVLGEVRDALINSWGTSYGWGILNQQELPEEAEIIIINAFKNEKNDLKLYQDKLTELIESANQQRDNALKDNNTKGQKKRGRKPKLKSIKISNDTIVKGKNNILNKDRCQALKLSSY